MSKGPLLQKIWDSLSDERKDKILKRTGELEKDYIAAPEYDKVTGVYTPLQEQKIGVDCDNIPKEFNRTKYICTYIY